MPRKKTSSPSGAISPARSVKPAAISQSPARAAGSRGLSGGAPAARPSHTARTGIRNSQIADRPALPASHGPHWDAVTETLLTWAAYPTINALANAVNALGNGWAAQIVGDAGATGDYGLWPSADLYVPGSYGDALEGSGVLTSQGALTARGQNAELKLHTYELAGYQWDPRGWLLRAIPYTDPELLHPEDLIWPVGVNNFRVQYTAGYSVIPEAVQEACARWVAVCWNLTLRDPSLASQEISGAIRQAWPTLLDHQPPPAIRALLAPYRRHTIANDQS